MMANGRAGIGRTRSVGAASKRVDLSGIRSADYIRASGMNKPQSDAEYMPAPDQLAGNTELPLATRRPSIHALTSVWPDEEEPTEDASSSMPCLSCQANRGIGGSVFHFARHEQEDIRSGLPVRHQIGTRDLGMVDIGGPARRWHRRYPHFRSANAALAGR